MPVQLRVPDRYAPALAEFLRLSPDELAGFLKLIQEEEPSLAISKLVDNISERLSIDRERVDEVVRLLRSLQVAREGLGLAVEDFVAELRAAMEASGKDELRPADWGSFQAAIMEALSAQTALSVSSKAWEILREHSHVYCYARVLTDLRPIFKDDLQDAPSAFVTVHTLKITYHENGEHKDFFVALDQHDVQQLAGLMERALKKEASLKALASEKALKVLEDIP